MLPGILPAESQTFTPLATQDTLISCLHTGEYGYIRCHQLEAYILIGNYPTEEHY